jgi:hypothetical protein
MRLPARSRISTLTERGAASAKSLVSVPPPGIEAAALAVGAAPGAQALIV